MSLFSKKTEAEKQDREAIKDTKREAREERKDARQDARDERKEARTEAREDRKDAREEKRDAMTNIRDADVSGKNKRDEKREVRDEKRDAIDAINQEKRVTIKDVNEAKRDGIAAITAGEIADIASISSGAGVGFRRKLALDLLQYAQATEYPLADNPIESTLNGSPIRGAVAITRKNWKSDTEVYVAHTDAGDVVVGFRSSETDLFDKEGAFKDWVLTDFRSHRMPYPPAPGSWPNQRWVHTGFWEAYELVHNELIGEVSRQAQLIEKLQKIYVTGFSLGGALALLAAMDLGDAFGKKNVELFTFAAPRVGDESLNKLLAARVDQALLIAYGGDPFVHLPPIGPNSPVTFKHPIGVDVGGLHFGLANPLPSVGQQYRTADRLVYIDRNGVARDGFPPAQIALDFRDHDYVRYIAALGGASSPPATTRATQASTA